MTKLEAFDALWCLIKGGYMYDLQWVLDDGSAMIGHREIDRRPLQIDPEIYAAWRWFQKIKQGKSPSFDSFLNNPSRVKDEADDEQHEDGGGEAEDAWASGWDGGDP